MSSVKPDGKKKILFVGIACHDMVHVVRSFPVEDGAQEGLDRYRARGGNASNSCTVATEVGEACEFFGTLAAGTPETEFLERDMVEKRVRHHLCPRIPGVECPSTCVILNAATGSRTMIHTNSELRELTPEDFAGRIDLGEYDWVSFEGRNPEAVRAMAERVRRESPGTMVSVEVELAGRGHEESLLPLADVAVVSKDVAAANGASDMEEALRALAPRLTRRGAILVCPWGELGAAAMDVRTGEAHTSPAFPPAEVVDSLGAGDAFYGALVSALRRRVALPAALRVACRVAGAKVGRRGFSGLREVFRKAMKEEWEQEEEEEANM